MDKSLILNEIKKHYSFKNDTKFAEFLGISPQLISNWKTRNTYDAKLIYTKCLDLSPEWILTGKGEMLKSDILVKNEVKEPGEIYSPDYKELYLNAKYTIEVQKELIESFKSQLFLIKELNTKSKAG